jgi:hypothetical protein
MKNVLRSTLSSSLVVTVFALSIFHARDLTLISASAAQKQQEKKRHVTDIAVKKGVEVAARVRKLKEMDKSVRAALAAFEKKGRAPRIEEAIAVTGKFQAPGLASNKARDVSIFRRVGFSSPQQATINENGIELIFITTLEMTYEWQGTIIVYNYDEYGNLLAKYVGDVVITASEHNPQEWTGRYEVSFDENGNPWLMHEPGMYTGFSLGTSIQEHRTYFGALPPLNLESWQFTSAEQQQQYYETYPQQLEYERRSDMEQPQVASLERVMFIRMGFQQRSDRAIERHQLRPCSQTNSCGRTFLSHFPGLASWARNTGAACGAVAGGCGLVSALFGGAPFAPCFVRGCATAAIYNAPLILK